MKTFIHTVVLLSLIGMLAGVASAKAPSKNAQARSILAKEKKTVLKTVLADEKNAFLLSKLRGLPQPRALDAYYGELARKRTEGARVSAKEFFNP